MIAMVLLTCNFWPRIRKKKNNTQSGSMAGMQQRYSYVKYFNHYTCSTRSIDLMIFTFSW